MTRDDLARALQEDYRDLTIAGSKEMVKDLFEIMKGALLQGETIAIHGFGIFKVKETKERKGHNPRTGESLTIPARRKVVFKPAKLIVDDFRRPL